MSKRLKNREIKECRRVCEVLARFARLAPLNPAQRDRIAQASRRIQHLSRVNPRDARKLLLHLISEIAAVAVESLEEVER
jgi:hypothetical protein